jgi:carboxyl-terminal processing protease
MRHALAALLLATVAGCGSTVVGTIGAVLGRDNDDHSLYVRDVPEGLAAAEAGLEPGDEIVMIDGVYVRSLGTQELRAKLRGEVGSKVALTVVRGERVMRVELARTPITGGPVRRRQQEEKLTE